MRLIDPGDVDHYLVRTGYSSLFKALKASPEETIQEILQSDSVAGWGRLFNRA